ncbi:MAG: triose-phosphate isomerase [Nitrospiria bacterium]
MRPLILVANWKMNKTIHEAIDYAHRLKDLLSLYDGIEIILASPFTTLRPLDEVLRGSQISLAAQNIHWEDSGPYTGEISAVQVREAGCRYVLIGHSERRQHFGEGYDQVNRKIHAAMRNQLYPVVCLGETQIEREAQRTLNILGEQISKGLAGIRLERIDKFLIAYEPVWAIGTGQAVTPKQAAETHQFIRQWLSALFGPSVVALVRVLYGGSITAENVSPFVAEPEVDGLLVGGASLVFEEFSEIVKCAAHRRS